MTALAVGGGRWPGRLRLSGLEALDTPNYRLFFWGQVVSESGTWLQRLAMSWLVLDLTNSSTALGTVQFFQLGPLFVLPLFTGVLADRLPRRGTLMVLQAAAALQATAIAVLTFSHTIQLWHVYALGTLLGVINSFEMPMRQAFLAELVERERLQSAVSLNATVRNASRVVGPALGGMIIAAWGVGPCFAFNAVSFMAVLLSLIRMDPRRLYTVAGSARGAMVAQVVDGFRYVRRTPVLAFLLLLLASVATLGFNFNVTVALLARYALDAGALGYGVFNMALGIGAVVGGLATAAMAAPTPRSVAISSVAFGALLLGVGLAPWFPLATAFLVVLGLVSTIYQAGTNVILQTDAEDAYRGRVLSLFVLFSNGTAPLGGWLTGYLADLWGIRTSVSVLAIGVTLSGIVALAYVAGRRPRAIDRSTAEIDLRQTAAS